MSPLIDEPVLIHDEIQAGHTRSSTRTITSPRPTKEGSLTWPPFLSKKSLYNTLVRPTIGAKRHQLSVDDRVIREVLQ
jgi:hypothetical protein